MRSELLFIIENDNKFFSSFLLKDEMSVYEWDPEIKQY